MNISLTAELDRFIKKLMENGRYASASEVVRDALRLLDDHERLRQLRMKELRREIQRGLRQLDRGQSKPFDKALVEDIKRRGRARLARQKKAEYEASRNIAKGRKRSA